MLLTRVNSGLDGVVVADTVMSEVDGEAGRLTVRERIDRLLDKDSFQEVGSVTGVAEYDQQGGIVKLAPANCVFGRGLLEGRKIVVAGDDFTLRGGSADASIWMKLHVSEQMAATYRLPLIRLLEGSGGGGSVRTIEKTGRANLPGGVGINSGLHLVAANMTQIPVVSLGLGSVAGLAAARLAASHYSVIVKELSAVFVAGPPVVNRLGETRTKNELGGWEIQTAAGGVDHAVDSEEEAFACARRFLSYIPNSIWDLVPQAPSSDAADRREEFLLSVVPRDRRRAYNMRRIVEGLVDRGSFFEMGRDYGKAIITGLCRLDGWPVAMMAGNPLYGGGVWDAAACQKIVRFVDLATTFHLPVVYFCDCPGFLIGLEAERSGVIRQGVRAMSAMFQTTVPWCSFIIRNAFGVAGAAHQNGGRLNWRYAWPSGRWGSLPLEGGIEAAYRAELDAAADPASELEKIEGRLNALRSPFRTAEQFWVEEIVDPRDTRRLLCDFANMAAPLRTPGPVGFGLRA